MQTHQLRSNRRAVLMKLALMVVFAKYCARPAKPTVCKHTHETV